MGFSLVGPYSHKATECQLVCFIHMHNIIPFTYINVFTCIILCTNCSEFISSGWFIYINTILLCTLSILTDASFPPCSCTTAKKYRLSGLNPHLSPSLSSFLYKKRILTTYHFDHKIFWRESYHMLHYFLNVSGKSEATHYGMAIEYRRYSLWGVLLPFWYHHFDGLYSQYPRHRVGTPHSSNLYLVRYMGGQTYETIFDTYPVQASWHFDDHIWIWWCCYPVRIMLPLPKLLPVSSLHLIPSCSSWPCSEDNGWSYRDVLSKLKRRRNG